ncbi:MAG: hypothetical protein HY709_10200 [Candidatus Latescibacteria bacterium]|nr:hypothetical protein [Candidatus Latescibacterota bacterium]
MKLLIKRLLAWCVIILTMPMPGSPLGAAQPGDVRALQVADAMMEAMGGERAFHNTRYLRFNFAVEREGRPAVVAEHLWDKHTGRYRVQWAVGNDTTCTVLFTIKSRTGKAYRNGQEIGGAELEEVLQKAYARFINDTYWLLMPYKWRDPGVRLSYVGEKREGDITYDVVTLSFEENIGLTPKDRYWGYVNRETHLMEKWEYVLRGANDPPTPFLWKNWRTYGKIRLSDEKVHPTSGVKIFFPMLAVLGNVDDRVFNDPNVVMP